MRARLVRCNGPRATVRPRLRLRRLAIGHHWIGPAVQQAAGDAGLALLIGAVGTFAGIVIRAALGAPGVVAGRRGRDGDEAGKDRRAQRQQRQLRLAHDPDSSLHRARYAPCIIRFRRAVLFQINGTKYARKKPCQAAGLQSQGSQDRYSTFRPANSTTFFHFSVSALISSPNASGVCTRGSPPSSTSRLV